MAPDSRRSLSGGRQLDQRRQAWMIAPAALFTDSLIGIGNDDLVIAKGENRLLAQLPTFGTRRRMADETQPWHDARPRLVLGDAIREVFYMRRSMASNPQHCYRRQRVPWVMLLVGRTPISSQEPRRCGGAVVLSEGTRRCCSRAVLLIIPYVRTPIRHLVLISLLRLPPSPITVTIVIELCA